MSSRRVPWPASGAMSSMTLRGADKRSTSAAVDGKGAERPQRDLAVIRSLKTARQESDPAVARLLGQYRSDHDLGMLRDGINDFMPATNSAAQAATPGWRPAQSCSRSPVYP